MKPQNPTVAEIIIKVLTDSRLHNAIAEIINEILTDATTQSQSPVTSATRSSKTTTPLAEKSNSAIYQQFRLHKQKNQPITPELHAEMAKRFSAYDAATQTFRKTRVRPIDLSKKTDRQVYKLFFNRKKMGTPITPELQAELVKRFPNYDAKNQQFTRSKKRTHTKRPKKVRVINWTTKSDRALRRAYSVLTKKSKNIPDELHTELARRIPEYDADARKMNAKRATTKPATTKTKTKQAVTDTTVAQSAPTTAPVTTRTPEMPPQTTTPASTEPVATTSTTERKINWAEKSDDIIIKAVKQRSNTPAGVDPALNAEAANRFPLEYDPSSRRFITTPKISHPTPAPVTTQPAAQPTNPTELNVTLTEKKLTLDSVYNNVYVNGKLLLRNHVNTQLCTFCDGALLGVHGIVTDNKELPTIPLWIIYDTNLTPTKWAGKDKFSGYAVYAKKAYVVGEELRLDLSNRCTVFLAPDKMLRLAGNHRFHIAKTK